MVFLVVATVAPLLNTGCGDEAHGAAEASPAPDAGDNEPFTPDTSGVVPGMPTNTGSGTRNPPGSSALDAGTAGTVPTPVPDTPADAGQPDQGSDVEPSFETLRFVIMQAPCLGAGCHNDDQNPLDLRVDADLHTRLLTHTSANCGDLPIVNPGNPQQSALVAILRGSCGPTPRMPVGCVNDEDGSCVPPEYIAALEMWIAAGAPP